MHKYDKKKFMNTSFHFYYLKNNSMKINKNCTINKGFTEVVTKILKHGLILLPSIHFKDDTVGIIF